MASIGIIGGMGPLATVRLFEEIVLNTLAGCDQDHIRIFIDNNPKIPDRTAFITGSGENPKEEIIRTVRNLLSIGADYLIMPCNTAHYFSENIREEAGGKFLDMIEETVRAVRMNYPGKNTVALMATKGTYQGKVYQKVSARYGINIIEPTDPEKDVIMELIYKIKGGIYDKAESYSRLLQSYIDRGTDCFILGCTELSVANKLYGFSGIQIDPLYILAVEAIRRSGGTVKENRGELK